MTDINAALDRIAARRPRIIDLSLDRVFAALDKLGAPHKKLPPVFHVAGTNGKGSTIAFLRAILEADNKSAHVYTSPHLVNFNERIQLNGTPISDAALISALDAVEIAVGDDKLTYFETTTCAALLAFSQQPADFLLLEVGLGGRLDATNVLEKPQAAIITPVDLDHQQFLGDTIGMIAMEKAGIMRRDAPAIIGRQSPEAMSTLLAHASEIGANAFAFGQDWDVYSERGRLIYQDESGLLDLDPPRLVGAHQIDNAGLAIAALKCAAPTINDDAFGPGVENARWPARLQRLTRGPLLEQAHAACGDSAEIWLDGGHNPHAARAIAQTLADLEARAPKPLILISGLQKNKDAHGYFEHFTGLATKVFTVAASTESAATADDIAAAAGTVGLSATSCADLTEALQRACAFNKNEPPRIFIGGSLYLAGEVLRDND